MTSGGENEKMNPTPMEKRRTIAITVGDSAGIGPEISLRCADQLKNQSNLDIILYGCEKVLNRVAEHLNLAPYSQIENVGVIDPDQMISGQATATTGLASFQAVDLAIQHAMNGTVDAIVTGPIQKEAWRAAEIPFPGHTELLAARTNTEEYCMMLTSETISCCLATIHIPLADVPKALTISGIERAIRLASITLSKKLNRPAAITVCGLNPHAGENGQFSHGEEENIIKPAIDLALAQGIPVTGPLPPDTAFTPSQRKKTDAYVCMYHDQGLIPLKALSFDDAINATLGLPIVRTSVDHGTALDIAWKGIASHQSMLSAIQYAYQSTL